MAYRQPASLSLWRYCTGTRDSKEEILRSLQVSKLRVKLNFIGSSSLSMKIIPAIALWFFCSTSAAYLQYIFSLKFSILQVLLSTLSLRKWLLSLMGADSVDSDITFISHYEIRLYNIHALLLTYYVSSKAQSKLQYFSTWDHDGGGVMPPPVNGNFCTIHSSTHVSKLRLIKYD